MQIDKIDLSRVNINTVDNKITSLANVAAKTNVANTFTQPQTFGTSVRLGYGGTPTIEPDDSSSKTLNFRRFNIDVGGKKITNVATPTANNDVATKQYVDSKQAIRKHTATQTLQTARENVVFTPTANQFVVAINVYRKRRNDNKWFLCTNASNVVNNYCEIYRNTTNGPVCVYPNSNNTMTDEFFIEIYYI